MKIRIIKHTVPREAWYTVQYKQLLFWQTWKDAYGCEVRYDNLDRAKQTARNLAAKEIKEVVE